MTSTFTPSPLYDNALTRVVGWGVYKRDAAQGSKLVARREAQHESSLAAAQKWAALEAARLQDEADANRARAGLAVPAFRALSYDAQGRQVQNYTTDDADQMVAHVARENAPLVIVQAWQGDRWQAQYEVRP